MQGQQGKADEQSPSAEGGENGCPPPHTDLGWCLHPTLSPPQPSASPSIMQIK